MKLNLLLFQFSTTSDGENNTNMMQRTKFFLIQISELDKSKINPLTSAFSFICQIKNVRKFVCANKYIKQTNIS